MVEITNEDIERVLKCLSTLTYVLSGVHGELKSLEKKGLMVGKYPYYYGKPAETNDMFLDWTREHLKVLKNKFDVSDLKPS